MSGVVVYLTIYISIYQDMLRVKSFVFIQMMFFAVICSAQQIAILEWLLWLSFVFIRQPRWCDRVWMSQSFISTICFIFKLL